MAKNTYIVPKVKRKNHNKDKNECFIPVSFHSTKPNQFGYLCFHL